MADTFLLGGDLEVNRLGFGAMRLCGRRILGWPRDRENALAVLRRAVELGVNLVDTSNAYGPEINEHQIAAALHPLSGRARHRDEGRPAADPIRRLA
jgi:pyridoxine 4-dehydrogenase